MKKFRCMPAVMGIPVVFFGCSLGYLYFLLNPNVNFVNAAGEPDPLGGKLFMGALFLIGMTMTLFTLHHALWRVELHSDRVICRGMFPRERFEIPYDTCQVGFEYHCAGGKTFWWICITDGPPPKYPSDDKRNRISKEKIRPGYIKMTFSEELYEALLEVLPHKQSVYLSSSRRFKSI